RGGSSRSSRSPRPSGAMSKACSSVGSRRRVAAAENEALVRTIFDAFAPQEVFALRGLFAEDAVWTVPGRVVMAGVYRGREEIFRFLALLPKQTDGTYGSRLGGVRT